MTIHCISNNFFPCDKTAPSVISTSSLVVAVVSAILIGVAYALHWGIPAIGSLSALTGLGLLVPILIILCKKKCRETSTYQSFDARDAERFTLPSQRFPHAFPEDYVADPNALPFNTTEAELYLLIKKGDSETFQQAIEFIAHDDLYSMCFCSHVNWVEPNDESITIAKGLTNREAFSLFHIILYQKDGKKKQEFLRALFTCIEDNHIEEHRESYLGELLEIRTKTLISLCIQKLNKETLKNTLKLAIKNNQDAWVKAFLIKWVRGEHQDVISDEILCKAVMGSQRTLQSKKELLNTIATTRGKTLETFEFEGFHYISYASSAAHKQITLMHLAVEAGDEEMVREFAASKNLLEKPVLAGQCRIAPLHRAVLSGNKAIVKILVDAGANKNAAIKQIGTTPATPLTLALDKGYKEIADLLQS